MPGFTGRWLGLAALAAAQTVLPLAPTSHTATPTANAPCAGAAAPATYKHVITIMEENHAYSSIIGSSQAPYENSLATACGLAKEYYAESYPSLPNYIALTSGTIPASVANRDCLPSGSCTTGATSIFDQVGSSGWKVYAESMPSNCYRKNTSNGLYLPRHTAAPYYTRQNSACGSQMVPLGGLSSGALASDLASGTLPKYSFVVPNATNDMHGGCVSCGDTWLSNWVPKIIASPAYQNGSTAIFITFDSDNGSAGNHIPAIVVSPSVAPGTTSSTRFTHYSLLRTTEDLLGIGSHLGKAAGAPSMRSAFHL
ncbi:MAG: alkaline phosphatase family protein [Gaiellales bacterium]